jgi:hypothetical protein
LNRNGLSCLPELARALHRPLPMLIHGAGDGRSPRTQCCCARAYDPKCRSHRHPRHRGFQSGGPLHRETHNFRSPVLLSAGSVAVLAGF